MRRTNVAADSGRRFAIAHLSTLAAELGVRHPIGVTENIIKDKIVKSGFSK